MGKIVKMSFEGQNLQLIGKWTAVLCFQKEIDSRGCSDPALGLYTCIILVKQVYWYISQVSGERLQDHWSSGCICENKGAVTAQLISAFVFATWIVQ